MKTRKTAEIKARVDERTKEDIQRLAEIRGLDTSDIIREAIRNLIGNHPPNPELRAA